MKYIVPIENNKPIKVVFEKDFIEETDNNTEIIIKHKLTIEEKEILKDIIKEV